MKIAALVTCHNRKEKTIACLKSFYACLPEGDVFLTDDGSTDGTADAIRELFPKVKIIHGDGNLYWSRGMRLAWDEALKFDYDYYLWLNDDIILYSIVSSELVACSQEGKAIVCGMVEDSITHEVIYSGYDCLHKRIQPSSQPQSIYYMNGNVVWISKEIVSKIGIIDPHFQHEYGDFDYGLTAIEHGIYIASTRVPIASGQRDHDYQNRRNGFGLYDRLKSLTEIKNSPIQQTFYFKRKHFGMSKAILNAIHRVWINILSDNMYDFYISRVIPKLTNYIKRYKHD